MANREELSIIKGARAGDTASQLALGKLYLFGGASLPKSMATALHWLQRAATQDGAEACELIGRHIPFDVAWSSRAGAIACYERAYDGGVLQAGVVLAQLVLADGGASHPLYGKAMLCLQTAAAAGLADAQSLLARQTGAPPRLAPGRLPPLRNLPGAAADGGVAAAQHALLRRAWDQGDWSGFLLRALPMARRLLLDAEAVSRPGAEARPELPLSPEQVLLLSRCARLLSDPAVVADPDPLEICRCWERAAQAGDRDAQLALGLWLARMDAHGQRVQYGVRAVNFKRAIRWLTQAGEQGLAEAWFALSRIYVKPEFSQRCALEAQSYLERAADMGHSAAQLECGIHAWRSRRDDENNDVRAAYWLVRAASQGSVEAQVVLGRIAPGPCEAGWLAGLPESALAELAGDQPLLAARLELARVFGLSRPEALLLDIHSADRGHCLLVDIRPNYGRSRRRLVLLSTVRERQVLDRVARLFERVDCGLGGPEGNYRQRLYRLKTCVPAAGGLLQEELLPA
ncbi:MAG: tetratricopeptide repeat protein [Pseudomonadota bacterium]